MENYKIKIEEQEFYIKDETEKTNITFIASKGDKGDKGDQGIQGPQGEQGIQGLTGPQGPEGPAGKDGTNGKDGKDGIDGTNGSDGISPIITTNKSGKETTITIVDAQGTKTATIMDGNDGQNGTNGTNGINGEDGFSPIANVTKSGNTATITVTDKIGTTTTTISDGVNGTNGTDGYTPIKGVDYFTQEDIASLNIPTKTSDLTNNSGFITGMVELSYGSSTWNDFINAYNSKKIVYCRASSNANPATGSQTRKAFMAYVNNADTPTSVEFQYVRSIQSHSDTQQGDQVYVYKLTNANSGTWSVETREMSTKIVPSTGLNGSYSSGTYTLTANIVTSLSSQSTDTQIPSAKCVYDLVGDIESLLSEV